MNNLVILPFAGLVFGGWIGVEVYEHLCNEEMLTASTPMCIVFAGVGVILGFIVGYVSMIKLEK